MKNISVEFEEEHVIGIAHTDIDSVKRGKFNQEIDKASN